MNELFEKVRTILKGNLCVTVEINLSYNLVGFQIALVGFLFVLVETPIGVCTRLNPVEIPIGICLSRNSTRTISSPPRF